MRDTFTFHTTVDARGKIQIPKTERETRNWTKGVNLEVTIREEETKK